MKFLFSLPSLNTKSKIKYIACVAFEDHCIGHFFRLQGQKHLYKGNQRKHANMVLILHKVIRSKEKQIVKNYR